MKIGLEPNMTEFLKVIEIYVNGFDNQNKQFTQEDEAQLSHFCRKHLNTFCKRTPNDSNNTPAHEYMCNEKMKNTLRKLEEKSLERFFEADKFCEDTAMQFNYPRDLEEAKRKLLVDAKKSGIKMTGKLKENYDNICKSTGEFYTLNELSKIASGKSELILDEDIKSFASVCHAQQTEHIQIK